MIYIYRRAASTSARELTDAIEGIRYRNLHRPIEQKAHTGDLVVCWGERLAADTCAPGVLILNGAPLQNKFQDAVMLKAAGVTTVEVARMRPAAQPLPPAPDPARTLLTSAAEAAEDFLNIDIGDGAVPRNQVMLTGIRELEARCNTLRMALNTPAPVAQTAPVGEWLARMNDHVGGNDLLQVPTQPDYYSKKETFVKEFRIHSLAGKSIRAGVKAPRTDAAFAGQTPHEWIRSWDGGWRIRYDGVSSKQKHRDLAHAAVAALGLQFGAVDIGERADGTLVVLECNRAPGLAEGTAAIYAQAIRNWRTEQVNEATTAAAPATRRAA